MGDWQVVKQINKDIVLCKCKCGLRKRLYINEIQDNFVCNHKIPNRKDLSGEFIGEWEVLKPTHKGYYLCKCSCGSIKEVYGTTLRDKKSLSCGHNSTSFKDIKDKQFGEWTALEYIGNHYWKCRCSCGTIRPIHRYSLLNSKSNSCGCKTVNKIQNTLISNGINQFRTDEQIKIVSTQENLYNYIINLHYKPTIKELSQLLSLNISSVGMYIHKYNLEEYVTYNDKQSGVEREILEYIKSIYNKQIVERDRTILNGREIDIYLPDINLAIEVNGDYWHSDIYKDRYYHQQKTLDCVDKGIRLIHIFEHEWINLDTQAKIKNLLHGICNVNNRVYARQCKLKEIDYSIANDFNKKYHLQGGGAYSDINLALYYNNDIIAVATFDKPRFNSNFEYELIRLTFKAGISVVGGSEKLLKYFINKYKPLNIISYCDISKYSGAVYERLGFTCLSISKPSYVWTNHEETYSRYQTQKHRLIQKGFGTYEQTEDEIMRDLGYFKVYNCGNKIYAWEDNKYATRN